MGFLKEAVDHGMKINLKWYIVIWGTIFVVGLLLEHFYGFDLLLQLFHKSISRP